MIFKINSSGHFESRLYLIEYKPHADQIKPYYATEKASGDFINNFSTLDSARYACKKREARRG